jgi:hypothetical protein
VVASEPSAGQLLGSWVSAHGVPGATEAVKASRGAHPFLGLEPILFWMTRPELICRVPRGYEFWRSGVGLRPRRLLRSLPSVTVTVLTEGRHFLRVDLSGNHYYVHPRFRTTLENWRVAGGV